MNQATHERFKANLKASQPAVLAVQGYLANMGYQSEVPALHVPGTFDDGIADSGDIILLYGGETYRIEVKLSRSCLWSELIRFPSIVVDKKSTWDAKQPKPYCYFIVDKTLKTAGLFECDNWRQTTIKRFRDQVTGIMEPCYAARPDLFTEVQL